MKLVFDRWIVQQTGKPVDRLTAIEEYEMGVLHTGSTFDVPPNLDEDEMDVLRLAASRGHRPVFYLVADE